MPRTTPSLRRSKQRHAAESTSSVHFQAEHQEAASRFDELRSELRDAQSQVQHHSAQTLELVNHAKQQALSRELQFRDAEIRAEQTNANAIPALRSKLGTAIYTAQAIPRRCSECPIKDARIVALQQANQGRLSPLG